MKTILVKLCTSSDSNKTALNKTLQISEKVTNLPFCCLLVRLIESEILQHCSNPQHIQGGRAVRSVLFYPCLHLRLPSFLDPFVSCSIAADLIGVNILIQNC